jgi:ABC-type multidrug transport system ATPase subunit
MTASDEAPLIVDVGAGPPLELAADDVHYLWRAGDRLDVRRTPADEHPERQLGYFIRLLGRWFFHAANVPAARVLRIDGRPVLNVRQELGDSGPVSVRLVGDVSTGPRRPRGPAGDGSTGPRKPAGDAATGSPKSVGDVSAGSRRAPSTGSGRPRKPAGKRSGPARDERPERGARRYTIGRAGTHPDIEIDDPRVRARHATARLDSQGRWWISGEVFVDNVRHMSVTLSEGDVFVIGQTAVTVSADLLPGARSAGVRPVTAPVRRRSSAETGLGVRLDHVTVQAANGRRRLDDVSLDIRPMEVVAVVGPSGAGKSSLINVLLGELLEDEGTVRIGPYTAARTDPELRRKQVRYVPQGDEGLFPTLTVRETLTYAARLRAAADTAPREIAERVNQVLERLDLDHVQDSRLHSISGGQRRRVSIGTELVGDPQLLLLDEPTSGLDPGKDRAIMRSLREVAATYRCTVVIVTHATEHLGFVDKVVTVGKGGRVRDAGPPNGVPAALGKPTWADLMVELDLEPPASPRPAPPPGGPRPRAVPPVRADLTGLGTLVSRQLLLTMRRGGGSLTVLFLVPLACTLLAVAASGDGLRPGPELGSVLSILVTVAALTGASLTYPDIVNDAPRLHRDFRVGVEASSMVLAKALVYSGLCALLAALVSGLFAALQELPPTAYGVPPLPALYLVVLLTMLASMGLGLLVSAGAPSLERAVTWSTLLAVLQVALSGTLFRLEGAFGLLTAVLPARLGLAAVASYADFNSFRAPPLFRDGLWDAGVGRWSSLVLMLLVVTAAAVTGSVFRLHRRFTRP